MPCSSVHRLLSNSSKYAHIFKWRSCNDLLRTIWCCTFIFSFEYSTSCDSGYDSFLWSVCEYADQCRSKTRCSHRRHEEESASCQQLLQAPAHQAFAHHAGSSDQTNLGRTSYLQKYSNVLLCSMGLQAKSLLLVFHEHMHHLSAP